MSARKKTKATTAGHKRRGAKATRVARSEGPTRAQVAAMHKIIAESGVVITEELLDELRRELRGTCGQPRTPKLTQPFEAHVRKGRLVLDAPTRLPEGEVVELVLLSDVLARGGDWLDDRERARLHRALERSVAQAKAGKTVDADEVIARLRARS